MSLIGQDRVCAVIAAARPSRAFQQLRAAQRLTRTLELRLDWFERKEHQQAVLSRLPPRSPQVRIATARRVQAGGRLAGSLADQLSALVVAGHACQWLDVEVDTLEPYQDLVRLAAQKRRLIASFHDFHSTPRDLPAVMRRLEKCRAHAIKVAAQCDTIADSLRVLELCRGRRNVIAVPMGEAGLPARVLALRHGSALAYASVGEKTAPGQVTLEEMKLRYRADRLNKRSRVYGLVGNPVNQSLGPVLHNAGFIARRLNDVYVPFLTRKLPDFLSAIEPLGIAGFSVTLPFKQAIQKHLHDCDPLAEAIGAVNTVVVRGGGKLYGYNTDYVGVLRALQKRVRLRGSRVLLYGAGGAARAVAFALAQEGAVVGVCARRPAQARTLARAVHGEVIARRHLRTEFFDAIINATPVGMAPHTGASPLAARELNCRLVFDLIYRPLKTTLIRIAEARGIETVSGIEMFLAQGMAQFEIWTGLRAPEKQMRAAVMKALRK
jgi:3-dehydroquinate dehydratase/shikimate dehydrogenase